MSRHHSTRRGFVMALVLAVMSLTAGMVAALTYFSAGYYRAHQADRGRLAAQAVSHSALAYVRAHAADWADRPPAEPIALDVADLLPPDAEAAVEISFLPADPKTCRITVRYHRGRYVFEDQFDDIPIAP